jgi:hypothetical protein
VRTTAAVLLALLAVGLCASPAPGESGPKPPARLWQAFPLEPKPAKPHRPPAQQGRRPPSSASASGPARAGTDSGDLRPVLVAGLLLALGAATIVLLSMTGAGAVVVDRGRAMPRRLAASTRRGLAAITPRPRRSTTARRTARPKIPRPTAEHARRRIRRAPSLGADLTDRLQEYKAVRKPVPLQLQVPPTPQHSPPPARDVGEHVREVGVWHGYTQSQFYAWTGSDEGRAIEISSSFRSRGEEPEQSDEPVAALEELLGRLEEQGWEVVEEGPRWFDRRLRTSPDPDVPAIHGARQSAPAPDESRGSEQPTD